MKINRIYLIAVASILFLASCKNDKMNENLSAPVAEAANKYENQPNAENAVSALDAINKELKENKGNSQKVNQLAKKALDIATKAENKSAQIAYLLLLNKDYGQSAENKSHLMQLADIMSSINKKEAANVLYSGVISRYAETNEAEEASKKISAEAKDIDAYLKVVGEKVFENPDKYGINRRSGQSYVDACEAYALAYPNTTKAADYLYKGTEVSRTLKTFTKSLTMYDWILEKYPQYEKAPTAMFLKGFIIENELNNADAAKKVYEEFLQKYPDSKLVDDVKFLLNNIGKSDEEIMKIIEENRKKNKK